MKKIRDLLILGALIVGAIIAAFFSKHLLCYVLLLWYLYYITCKLKY